MALLLFIIVVVILLKWNSVYSTIFVVNSIHTECRLFSNFQYHTRKCSIIRRIVNNIRSTIGPKIASITLTNRLTFVSFQWKTELDEVIEVAALDSELWVSMIAETIKTFPATGSLNTEISDYEETRPIFTDMVNELRKYVNKHSDLSMLPLECQYLNKLALTSVVS